MQISVKSLVINTERKCCLCSATHSAQCIFLIPESYTFSESLLLRHRFYTALLQWPPCGAYSINSFTTDSANLSSLGDHTSSGDAVLGCMMLIWLKHLRKKTMIAYCYKKDTWQVKFIWWSFNLDTSIFQWNILVTNRDILNHKRVPQIN